MADELDCSRGTLQGSLDRLCGAGYVERRRRDVEVEAAGKQPSLAYAYRVLLDRDDFDVENAVARPEDDETWSHAESAFQEGGCQPVGTGGASPELARGANPGLARGANSYVSTKNDPFLTTPVKRDEIVPRETRSAFTAGSKVLAAAFLRALGIVDPLQIPPELAGLDYRAVMWAEAGWPPDMVAAEAARFASDQPPKPISYFEKVFATAFARRQAPLPVAEVRPVQAALVTSHDRTNRGNCISAADRLVDRIRGFDARPGSADGIRGGTGEAAPRLLPKG